MDLILTDMCSFYQPLVLYFELICGIIVLCPGTAALPTRSSEGDINPNPDCSSVNISVIESNNNAY